MMSPEKIAQKYVQNTSSMQAQQAYVEGVNSVTQSPTALAATPEAEQRYLNGVQQSVSSGKRAAKLNNITLQQWKQATTGKGAQRLASGAQAAQSKVMAHFQKFGPAYEAARQAAAALPKGGMANAMARVQAAMTVLMQAAGKNV